MILYLTIALIALYVGYVSIITIIYGVLRSISKSFYILKKKEKGYWFRILMFTSGLLLILIAAYYGSEHSWALYTSGIGAILTGAAALYYDKITGIVHYIASGVMIVFALVFIGLMVSWIPMTLVGIGLLVVLGNREEMPNPVFWFEVYAFNIVLGTLLWMALTL